MHPLVPLAAGYAGLLLVVAAGLEWLARHTAARAERYRTAGFSYHPEHDLWVCPRDEPLWPYEVDRDKRLVRYRARPTVCGACPVRHDCAGSATGREIVRPIDPWPHSEAGRFHRGVSVTLTVLAMAFLATATAAHHRGPEMALTLPAMALTGWLLYHWGRDFLRTPSGFPDTATIRHRAEPATAPRAGTAGQVLAEMVAPPPPRRRTTWGFDRPAAGRRYRSDRRGRGPGEEETS